MLASALAWGTEAFLMAGAGARVGGLGGPGGLVGAAGQTAAGFRGTGFGSGHAGGTAVGLGARLGAGGGKQVINYIYSSYKY